MKNIYRTLSGYANRTKAFAAIFSLMIMLGFSQQVFAEANYVYHEQTTNNPGCGPNYMSTTSPTNAAGVQLAWKIEYQFYTTNTVVYYTTDGSTPSGAFGVGTGTTQVLTGSYNCTFPFVTNVDVATATIPAQAAGKTVKYIISSWHSGGGNEIFANGPGAGCGCGTPTNSAALATVFTYTVAASNNVEVTSTGGTALASYATLKGAFDAVNAGTHTGSITVKIYGNTTETATAALNASGTGSASYTSMSIQPAGGAARSVSGAITAGSPMIDFNGADNVTVDGLNSGGNSLTFSNTTVSSTSGTATIRFQADATNNTITKCSVLGSATMAVGTNGGNISFQSAAISTGNDNNTISFCDLGPAGANLPSKCIHFSGTSNTDPGTANSGITITGNNIFDYFSATVASAGIDLNSGTVGTTISNNKFYQTATRTQTTGTQHSAIRISNTSGNGYQITGNTIGFASSTGTGTYTFVTVTSSSFVPVFLSVGSTTASSFQGNTIAGIAVSGAASGTTSSGPLRLLYISSGLVNVGDITGNTFGNMSITGSITYTSSSTSNSEVTALYNNGSANWVCSNNNIGGITVNNSSTGAALFCGIRNTTSTSATFTCNANTIGGTISNSIQCNTTATGTQAIGIGLTSTSFQPISTITSNIIRNITVSGGTGTTTSASVIGIVSAGTATNQTISQNTIFNLSNSNTTAASIVTGIQFSGSTANIVERNLIYGLTSSTTSTSAEINGIRIAGGTTTYRNNMIALGAGVSNAIGSTASNSGTTGIVGINEALGTNNIWHNNIYIGGTATAGTGASYAFNGVQVTNTRSFRDNLFVNARTNSGATGKHYAVKINGTTVNPTGLTINNNIYYAPNTGGVFGFFNSLDVASLGAWQTAVGQDAGSFSSDPAYIDPTNATPDLHISAVIPTQVESNGFDVGVTNDYDNQTRSGLTPTDIGADAGNFTLAGDINAPSITYTLISGTCSTGDQTLTATITDASGVPTTGSLVPRVYFKKNAGSYTSAAGTLTAGTGTSGTWSFTISAAAMGGLSGGDVVSYYVIAQDIAGTPNIASNPSGVIATNVNTITTHPSSPNTFAIGIISGTYTVGVGGNFTTLTAAVAAYNAGCIGGPIVFNLIDATYPSETFPITVNAVAGSSSTNTLTIKPNTTATISGSSASSIIKLNGADYIIIDGSNAGGTDRSLTITNTNTSAATAAIWVASTGVGTGATNNIVKNVNISCGADQSTGTNTTFGIIENGAISITGTTPQQDNDNNTYQNNAITKARYGIFSIGESSANPNQNLMVTNNLIGPSAFGSNEIGKGGVVVANANAATIAVNEIRFVGGDLANTSSGTDRAGISFATDASWTPSSTTVTNSTIARNNIHDIIEERTFSAVGVIAASSALPSNNTIANNMIYNVRSDGTGGDQAVGIGISAGSGDKIVYNSISLTGDMDPGAATSASTSAAGIRISSTSVLNLTAANNVVSVDVTSNTATLKHYAYVAPSAFAFGTGFTNYNDLYVNAANTQMVLGGIGTSVPYTDKTTLAAWQTSFTPSQEANSKTDQPVFISSTDLHLNTTSNNNLNAAATPIAGVTTDYDNGARDATTPDMGADEFVPPTVTDIGVFALVSPAIGTGCYSATETFSISVKNFGTVAWDFAAVNASITASVSGAATGSYPLTIIDNSYNGGVPLAAGASMTVTLGTLDMMLPGTYTFNASISAAGDALATNDAMTATDRTSTNPTVSLAGTSPVCEGGTITLTATSSGGTLPGTVSGTNTTPAAIPDNTLTGVASTIAISAPASTVSAATQLAVGLNVSGTFNADVDAYLIGPGGCGTIELTTDNGSSGDGFNITLYNSGAFPSVTTLPTTGTPTGNYLMEGTTSTAPATLSGTGTANYPSVVYTALNGCPINGTWTLFAGDDASGDTHTVQNWSLSITQPGLGTYTNTFSGPGTFGTTTYSGANNSTGTTTVTGLAPGTYTFNVTATDATGCTSISSSTSVTVDANTTYYADADGDTYGDAAVTTTTCDGITPSGYVTNNTDCDDTNSAINPGAAEICNGIDDDCDGSMDEGLTFVTYYADADGDTYGDATSTVSTCDGMPMGYVADNTDCDDTNADINPAATEICNAIDDDCDGSVDEGLTYYTYYADAEGDGFGDPFSSISSCSVTPPSGYVTDNSDCQPLYITYNDLDGDSFGFGDPVPCGSVINNVDCDDTQWLYYDADGDGYGAGAPIECGVPTNTDCAPFNGAIYPGATELCNGIDDDCDGSIDNGLLVTYYADTDGDTYGDPFNSVTTCSGAPVGYVLDNTDCEDIDADIHPGATEVCNGLDDDCNGLADDGLVFITYYSDSDGDGYGDPLSSSTGCSAPVGFVTDNTDCNDANAAINPGATEICNGIDDDCDGTADDGLTFTTYYVDVDGDGYGNPAVSVSTCDGAPFGYVTDNTDCEDNIFEVNPATVWYLDNDADLYYTGTGVTSCTSPGPGYVYAGLIGGGDCNDGDTFINPGATEICNGIDDDCNGSIDDGLTFITYYADADGDTYGDAGSSVSTCDGVPMGYVADNTDCNDSDAAINPAATEICNGIDDDCDGSIDEGLTFLNYYVDADGDGYGDASASPVNSCSPVAGYVTNNLDCNDSNNLISPAGTEICNGVDDNCDGTVDDGILYTIYYADADGDTYGDAGDAVSTCDGAPMGYVADNTDCNDANAAVNPGATEICNGIDDDCDGSTDEGLTLTTYYADVDGDTYGDAFNTTTTCDGIPSGYVVDNTDCDDTQNTVYPGAPEICDGLDNDCDGDYDEGTVTATITPAGPITICKGDPTPLSANTGVGYTYQWFKNGNVIVGATADTYFATKPGNYQVQVNVPAGCFALSSATLVQVNPQPNANISAPNGTSLCATVKLKASYDATYTWQWYKDGSPIGGATNYLYIATLPGSYECQITNAYGCTRTTAALTVTACREGETVDAVVEETFELYPNPTESIFTLDMELNTTEQVASVYILNIVGEQVYAGTVGIDNGTINTTITLGNDIAAGMYVVKVIVAEKEYTKQLIIQK